MQSSSNDRHHIPGSLLMIKKLEIMVVPLRMSLIVIAEYVMFFDADTCQITRR